MTNLAELTSRFLDTYNAFYPHNASFLLGIHQYDGQVPDFSEESIERWRAQLGQFRTELQEIDFAALDKLGQFDYLLIEHHIELELLRHGSLRYYERNPIMPYLYIFDVSNYIKRHYAPLEQRVEALCRHLEATPRLLEQLMKKLDPTLSRASIEISLETFRGFAKYYNTDLKIVEGLENAALQGRLEQAADLAGSALNNYVKFFEAHLERADENYAIGADNYSQLLKWGEMVDLPLETVLEIGMADMRKNQEKLKAICEELAPGQPVQDVIRKVGSEHPTNDMVVTTTRKYLESIRQHLIDANIVDMPTEVRCLVDETPLFMRWVFADMETPGPFEEVATEAHFYITPANEAWPEEQQDRWLSRFNDYVIQIFSMHEAYPGHYLQHLHARNSPSRAAKNLTSYSFIEGWAHYCEQMMLEEGFGKSDPVNYAKLQLSQLTEALVRDCRYVCGVGLHTQNWTVEQAKEFYQANAYMEEVTALRETQRSTFDPAGLNYTIGKLLFYKLKADYMTEKGAEFSLKTFHNECLAYGMPPVPLLRHMMLQNPSGGLA